MYDFTPRCVATTGRDFCTTFPKIGPATHTGDRRVESNFFRSAQFTADGTTIITHNEDQSIRTFVLPADLLDNGENEAQSTKPLKPYSTLVSASPVQAFAVYPGFSLHDPSSTLVLSGASDVPIKLSNALDYSLTNAKYLLINSKTEAYMKSYSLIFARDGSRFISGTKDQISVFDISRSGSHPITSHAARVGPQGGGCHGVISALAINHDNVLATGSISNRQVSLLSNEGQGSCTAQFSVSSSKDDHKRISGGGITQLLWSQCCKYLYIAERFSNVIQIYDVRDIRKRIGWLAGRRAKSAQRIGMDLIPTRDGSEIWAGGLDGGVRMWSNPGAQEGEHLPDGAMALHEDSISSTIWHPQGAVLATSSGQRIRLHDDHFTDSGPSSDDEGDKSDYNTSSSIHVPIRSSNRTDGLDNSLKIWTL